MAGPVDETGGLTPRRSLIGDAKVVAVAGWHLYGLHQWRVQAIYRADRPGRRGVRLCG
jgi:hypothetical protein